MSVTPDLISEVDFEGNPTASYYDTAVFDDDVVSYYRFNTAVNPFVDELDRNEGSLHGSIALTPGFLPLDDDFATAFDGVTDYASVPSSSTLLLAGSYSLHGFLEFPNGLPGAKKVLWTKGSFKLEIRADNKVQFSVQNHVGGVSTITTVVSSTIVEQGVRYHVICVLDVATGELRLYVNGLREDEAPHTVGTELHNLPLLFAAGHSSVSPAFATAGAEFQSAPSDPWVIGAPAGVAAGDLMLCHAFVGGAATLTPPAGWQALASSQDPVNLDTSYVFWRIATAADVGVANYSFDASAATAGRARITRYTGVDPAAPFANPPYAATGNGVSAITGAKLPQCDDVLALALVSMRRSVSWTSPDGTEMYDSGGANSPGQSLAGYYAVVADSSAKGFTATSNGSQAWAAFWIALKGPDAQDFANVTLDEWGITARAFDDDTALDVYTARLSGEGTYTDVTADSKGCEVERGGQYEIGKIEPGSLTETLLDLARAYDPSNTESPHYPNVITKRRKRNRADVNGTIVPLFVGYVEQWPQSWATSRFAQTTLTASDGMTPLGTAPVGGITIPSGLSGAQIHRLLDKARWPRALRAIDDGVFTMAAWTLDAGANAKDSIGEIVDSELGLFFISAAGVATFHDNAHRFTAARSLTPQAVFTDVQADIDAGGIPYMNPVPGFDDQHQVTEWQVTDAHGNTAVERDVIAGRRGFASVKTRSTRLDVATDAAVQARALLASTARPAQRFDSITVSPDNFADWLTVLSLEISDRVTIVAHPVEDAVGSPIAMDCFIEGIHVNAEPENWTVTFQLSAVAPLSYYDTIIGDGPVAYYRMDD